MTEWFMSFVVNSEIMGTVILSYIILHKVVLHRPKPKWYRSYEKQ